jgi:Ca2+-binding EF-hand superfamily protein
MKKQMIGVIALAVFVGSAGAEEDKKAAYFKKFDADGDGKLNKAEFTEMTKTQLEKKGRFDYEEQAAKRFKNKDTNGDGFITLEEYKASAAKLKKEQS